MFVKLFLSILSFLTVSLTAPSAGTIQSGSNATVTASVTDPNTGATITGVNFYAGSNFIGSSTASPYTITWAQPVDGTYSLTATAIDSFDATGTSSGVSVTVGTPVPTQTIACGQTESGTLSVDDGTSWLWGPQHYANDFTFNVTSAPQWVVISQQSTALDSLATLYDWDATFSTNVTGATDANPIMITAANHGLTSGQPVTIAGAGGTNTNANGSYYAGNITTNTFKLYSNSGLTTQVDGNGTYSSGGTATATGAIPYTDLVIDSSGSASTVSSAAHPFQTTEAGEILEITGGTGFTPGIYAISSVNSSTHVATLSGNVGTNGSTAGVGTLAVVAYNDDSQGVPPDSQIVADLQATGTYTIEASSAAPYQTGPFTVTLTCPTSTPSATLLLNTPGSTIGSLEPVVSGTGTINMGSAIPAGVPVTETLTLQNAGTEDAAITSASTTGTGFSISAPPQIVKAGTQVTFTLSFIGSASESGALNIANTSGTNPYTVDLSATVVSAGTAVATSGGGLTLTQSSIGPAAAITIVGGTSATATVTLAGVPISDQVVSLASADPSLVTFPGSVGTYTVTVPAGTSPPQETVTLTTTAVSAGQEPTIEIEASTPANTSGPVVANLTLLPPQGTAPSVSLATPTGNPSAITTSPLVFGQGTVISLVATASAAGSAHIAYVQYYGSVGGGAATLLGQQDEGVVSGGTTTYSFVWPGAVNGSWSVYAVATDTNGHASSDSTAQTFTVEYFPRAATPTFTPSSGTYTGWVPISSIGDSTSGASIYYTVDGSDPTSSSTRMLYGGSAFKLFSGTLKAVAVESGYLTSYVGTATFTIDTTGVSGGLVVALSGPTDRSEITSPTSVTGSVTPLSGVSTYWQITCSIDGGNGSPIVLNSGTITSTTSVSANMDTTLMLDGQYSITLSAIDTDGNSASQSVTVVVNGHEKIGYFTLSYTDMTIPIGGMPISIIRTYDSRDKSAGDFGVGWKLSTTNATAAKSDGVDGFNWNYTFSLLTYQYVPVKPHLVTITLPGDDVYNFVMTLSPDGQSFEPLESSTVIYQQVSGHWATLSPVNMDPNVLIAVGGGSTGDPNNGSPDAVELMEGDGVTPYDPQEFVLTLHNGTQYDVSVSGGLQSITDRNGNVVSFSSSGITDSNSRSISITRSGNYITGITDMNGNTFSYSQDGNGNLSSATDRDGNTTIYGYDSNHDVTAIHAPDGSEPIENAYYSDGRLEDTVNPLGTVNYYYTSAIEPGGNQPDLSYLETVPSNAEVTTDALGNPTVTYYDSLGNATEIQKALLNSNGTFNQWVTTSYQFSDSNNPDLPTEITDPLGHTATTSYDSQGNQLSITTHLGSQTLTTSSTYDAYGNVLTHKDVLGNVTGKFAYDANGNLLSETDALGNTTTRTYGNTSDGPMDQLTSATKPDGGTVYYSYDAAGQVLSTVDALGHVTRHTYDPDGNTLSDATTYTNSVGQVVTATTTNVYDAQDRLISTTGPAGATTQTLYNSDGQVYQTVDAVGDVTANYYDSSGNLHKTQFADGTSETRTYDADNRVTIDTYRSGRGDQTVYDSLGRVTERIPLDSSGDQISNGSGGIVMRTTAYDLDGDATSTTDADGNTTTSAFDSLNRQISATDALGNTTQIQYDVKGRKVAETDPDNHTTSFGYDNEDRQVATTYADGTESSVQYDADGNKTTETDQAGHTTSYGYDLDGNLVSVTDPLGHITRYTYNELGKKISQTDANGHVTLFAYDVRGNLIQQMLPAIPTGYSSPNQSESMTYDTLGRLSTSTDYNGTTTTYAYDSNGRVLSKTASTGAWVQYTYNSDGQVLDAYRGHSMTTDSTLAYTYSSYTGDVTEISGPNGTLNYTYDSADNELSVAAPNGTLDYSYDADNRISTVKHTDSSLVASYAYDFAGRKILMTRGNGATTNYGYDTLGRLITVANSVGPSFTYNLAADGKWSSVTQTGGAGPGTTYYVYDAGGRLLSEVGPDVDISYIYDAVGNRLSKTISGTTTNYTYDANDRITNSGYSFDANGNQTTFGGLGATYDFENHLVQLGSSPTALFTYDANGNRLSQTVSGTTTDYLVDSNTNPQLPMVAEEHNSSGGLLARYDYDVNLISSVTGGTLEYYITDGHGNTAALSGGASDNYAYDAYGDLLTSISSSASDFMYNGQELDSSGLYYLRARYYNPLDGRFLSTDPYAGDNTSPVSLHRYLYGNDNPVTFSDPSGRMDVMEVMVSIGIVTILAAVSFEIYSTTHNPDNLTPQVGSGPMDPLNRTKVQWLDVTPSAGKSSNDLYQELEKFPGWDNPQPSPLPIGPIGAVMTWGFTGFLALAQDDFQVRVIQKQDQDHFFAVECLSGHTLAGYRYWRVIDLPNSAGKVRLETVADDHPLLSNDYMKNDYLGGEGVADSHWAAMLRDSVKIADPESLYVGTNYGALDVGFMRWNAPTQIVADELNHGVSSSSQIDFNLPDSSNWMWNDENWDGGW